MKKSLLLLSAATMLPMLANAQVLKEGYITWPESQQLATYVNAWNNNRTITVNGSTWEDEEFFISRVKPRVRFENPNSQVYPERISFKFTDTGNNNGTDKRLVYWVCASDEMSNGVRQNALPTGAFDQEVFNMWSYVDHYGNWNCPFGWTPGAFADAAHKNGVAVSGVAGIPNASLSGDWLTCINNITSAGATKVGKFLNYFGQDGLGYNSEFSTSSSVMNNIISFHDNLQTYMADKNPIWEIMWYAGTTDGGSIAFDHGVGTSGSNSRLFKSASMFLNYNWNNTGTMSSSISYAKGQKINPFKIYAGMNMQGGEPKSGENYPILKDYQYSIGLWAGHNDNMLWKNRQSNGSNALVKQRTYVHDNEMLFGNGKRNPAIKQTITTNRSHYPREDFAGMSSMMNARSVLQQTIADEPFITYFNLGNGQFFNWKGDRQNDAQWYNLGVQDYTPTWRWWFAPTLMKNTVTESEVANQMSADFTWEDAYMGGSCLKIEGSTTKEYLHLFKTDFTVAANQKITVRYKLLEGEGDVRLVVNNATALANAIANGSTPAEPSVAAWKNFKIFTASQCPEVQDQSYKAGAEGWVTKTFNINAPMVSLAANKNISVLSLEFTNCKNVKMLIGELSIAPSNKAAATPAAPKLKTAKTLYYGYKGADAKLIWTMDNDQGRQAGTPVYNSDVKTSWFRTWSQQEGEEPVNVGVTTSWASIIYQAPVRASGAKKMRFGVSAVSTDFQNESAITWSDYFDLPGYVATPDIAINKNVIKPGENFKLNFVDDQMPSGTWTIKNSVTGATAWTGNGREVLCDGLSDVGAYDLVLTYTMDGKTVSQTFPRYIAISSNAVGALPEIYTLAIDGKETSEDAAPVKISPNSPAMKFSYTGRYAEGKSSRGIDLAENWFGVQNSELEIQSGKSFSVAAWVRIDELPEGRSNFLTIEDRIGGGWPYDNWGWFWSRINEDGKFLYDGVDTAWGARSTGTGTEDSRIYYRYDDAKIDKRAWTHFAIVFEYGSSTSQFRMHFYINGVKQKVSAWINANKGSFQESVGGENGKWTELERGFGIASGYGTETYNPDFTSKSGWPMTTALWIAFGGSAPNVSAVNGSLDDFQVWGKAMTQDDVMTSMNGLDKNNLPADVLGYWDFETDPVNNAFTGYTGANAKLKSPKAYWYTIADSKHVNMAPRYLSGCPFLTGEAYVIETKPTWKTRGDISNIQHQVVEGGTVKTASAEPTAAVSGDHVEGSADIQFARTNDYTVELTLENGHGADTKLFPVVSVDPTITGIEGVESDNGGVVTYTVDSQLFLDFAQDGDYQVAVYNMAGMLVADKTLNVVAGQTATITLGAKGVYLVKIVKDGRELRTVKVIRK